MNPAIVISAYNRPKALLRLLNALKAASYPEQPVPLHISLDQGQGLAAEAVRQISLEFDWKYGPKEVVCAPQHLGLLRHFYRCGDLSLHYGAIILLEDDLLVSPQFYRFACQALDAYSGDERIAGISLYTLWFNGYTHHPFTPMPDQSDVFFLQIPYTQGQAFTGDQWLLFKSWVAARDQPAAKQPSAATGNQAPLHELFEGFDTEDWFPQRTRYLTAEDRYYVFPRHSLSTGCGDAGTHFSQPSAFFQVALQNFQCNFRFQSFDQAPAVYDSFYEILPERLQRLAPGLTGLDLCVDLNGTKSMANLRGEFVISCRPARRAIQEYGRRMLPPEANLIAGTAGSDLRLSRREDLLWGRLADLAVRKSNFDYATRRHSTGKKTLLQFALYGWLNRLGLLPAGRRLPDPARR